MVPHSATNEPRPSHSRGFALPIVLLITGLLLAISMVLWQSSHDDIPRALLNLGSVQASFLAKGALQHALLKVKLMPTQGYDAAAYAVGKNPYFNHSSGAGGGYDMLNRAINGDPSADPQVVHGPAYIAGVPAAVTYDAASLSFNITAAGQTDINLSGSDDAADHVGATGPFVCQQYLTEFVSDIKTDDGTGALPVVFKRDTNDTVMGTGVLDPFEASYSVSNIVVVALGGGRRYKEEAVRVTVTSQLTGRQMVAKMIQDKVYTTTVDTIVRVSRSTKN